MTISVKEIFSHSAKFSGVNILTKFLSFPVSIVVAMVLSPKDYGILGYISVYTAWASFISPGFMSAACRELPGLIESKKLSKANYLQNVAITGDLCVTIIATVLLITLALFQKDPLIQSLMIIIFLTFAISKMYNMLYSINFAYKEFSLTAKVQLIRAILYPILTIIMIFWINIYTPPIVALLLVTIAIIYLIYKRDYGIRVVFDWYQTARLFRIGIVLMVGTLLYTLFTDLLDKTLIAAYLTKEALGLWVFSQSILILILGFFKDYGRVLKPVIWGYSSNISDTRQGFQSIIKMSIYFSLSAAIITGISQSGFIFLVNYLTVNFVEAQYVFLFLSLYIFWEAMEKFPEMVLYSEKTNRQKTVTLIWGSGVLINLILDLIAIKLGYGIVGIAIATVLSQVFTTTLMNIKASTYLFENSKEFYQQFIKIMAPFLITIAITFTHWMAIIHWNIDLPYLIFGSIIAQLSIWYLFTSLFYKDFMKIFSFRAYLSLLKNI